MTKVPNFIGFFWAKSALMSYIDVTFGSTLRFSSVENFRLSGCIGMRWVRFLSKGGVDESRESRALQFL